MEVMRGTQYNNREDEDPLAPISSQAVDRVAEMNSDSAPRKSVRQRLGSMAARRSVRRYGEDPSVRPHIVEQAVVEQSRLLGSDKDPRTA